FEKSGALVPNPCDEVRSVDPDFVMNGPTQLLMSTMKPTCLSLVALLVGAVSSLFAAPLGSMFSYQGRLTDDGAPATGSYDLQFTLFGAQSGGAALAGPLTVEDTPVTNGLFTVSLDFGATAFNGDARWLEIGVRPGASTGNFTTLSPRQPLLPAPYALF